MKCGTVPLSAFVPGHTLLLIPLAYWISALHTVTKGGFYINGKPYSFTILNNGTFHIIDSIHPDYVVYPAPDRIIDALRQGKALPDPIQNRQREALITKLADQFGGKAISLHSIEIMLDGKPYRLTLREK